MMLDIEKDWKNIQYNLIFYEKEKKNPSEKFEEKTLEFRKAIQRFYCKIYDLIQYSLNNCEAAKHFAYKYNEILLTKSQVSPFCFENFLCNSSICLYFKRLKKLLKNTITLNLVLFYNKINKEKGYKDLKKLKKNYIIFFLFIVDFH